MNNIGLSVHNLFTDMEERQVAQNVNPKEIAAFIPGLEPKKLRKSQAIFKS